MRRITPDMPLDVAQRIVIEESGDLKARWMLIDRAESLYDHRIPEAASLIHAYKYLEDREAYEREPWPKGMIRILELPARHSITGGRR